MSDEGLKEAVTKAFVSEKQRIPVQSKERKKVLEVSAEIDQIKNFRQQLEA